MYIEIEGRTEGIGQQSLTASGKVGSIAKIGYGHLCMREEPLVINNQSINPFVKCFTKHYKTD
jgi:hypothetical protein